MWSVLMGWLGDCFQYLLQPLQSHITLLFLASQIAWPLQPLGFEGSSQQELEFQRQLKIVVEINIS